MRVECPHCNIVYGTSALTSCTTGAKNVAVGSNLKVRKGQERETPMGITEEVKYFTTFIFLYAYWQVCLWILGKSLKRKLERH